MERTWRIGDLADRTGLSRRTLRHYDALGLLVPSARSRSDYRLYDAADLLRLLQIQNLKALGLSLNEIAEALSDPTLDATATLRGHLEVLTERIAAEQRLADRLATLAEAADRSWDEVLEAIAMTRLGSHTDPVARLRAALVPDGRSTAELFSALEAEDDPGVREGLVWALAGRPGAAATARSRLATAAPRLRPTLVRLLGKAGDRDAVPLLVGFLDDRDPATVSAAVTALRQLPDPRAATRLAGLLGEGMVTDADLGDALVDIGPSAAAAVLPRLDSDSADARLAAVETLGAIAAIHGTEQGAALALLDGLDRAGDDASLAVRRAALVALAEFGADGRDRIATRQTDAEVGNLARRLLELPAT